MKMYFYRGEAPNFGDELNEWLLPKIFKNFFDQNDETLFLGIGSILFDHHPRNKRKLVFGSGFGGYTSPPTIDDKWMIYCVRGPRTADACGLDRKYVAGDAAILINHYRPEPIGPSIAVSFMPHFQSAFRGHWQVACRRAGIHYIDPRKPVDAVLEDIQASQLVISEAMHGAIVADALRVPWIPVLPFDKAHVMKWFDWAEALDVSLTHHSIPPSSLNEAWQACTGRDSTKLRNARGIFKFGLNGIDEGFIAIAAFALRRLAKREPLLSTDTSMRRVLNRLEEEAGRIQSDFA
ncbi:polysaccharide pyruvyl transferase family protein [Caballeronia sp. LjRoot31]|uniref:polysaccharide pyruvyl transferase family protein n=1 Tax=Caballeronia sp. LjRoot31 TaxID=3342324 RepID=UPI003ECFAD3C